jgi:ribosomal protein S25
MDDDKKEKGIGIKGMDTVFIEDLSDRAYTELKKFKKISTILVMKKYQLNEDAARKICQNVWLRQHIEAREMAKGIE